MHQPAHAAARSVAVRRNRRPIAAVACLAVCLVGPSAAIAKPPLTSTGEALHPITAEVGKPFFDRLQQLAGPDAIACGFVPIGKDLSDAVRCAKKANNSSQAFWIGAQLQGIDSQVFHGAARGPDGRTWFVAFDSNTHEMPLIPGDMTPTPRLTESVCKSLLLTIEQLGGVACR